MHHPATTRPRVVLPFVLDAEHDAIGHGTEIRVEDVRAVVGLAAVL